MFRDPDDAPQFRVNVDFRVGGLGDNIAKMTVIRHVLEAMPHISMDIWVPTYFMELARHWVGKEKRIKLDIVDNLAQADATLTTLRCDGNYHSNLKAHIVTHAWRTMIDTEPPSMKAMEYYRIEGEPSISIGGDYIVITPNFTAKSRAMSAETINGITDWAIGQGLQVVYLGQMASVYHSSLSVPSHTPRADYSKGIALFNKTSLLEAARIMAKARAVVGLDTGLQHLAACTDAPIVGGFSIVKPDTRIPVRHGRMGWRYWAVVPEATLKCRFCQSTNPYVFGHDFRNCFYEDYQCLEQLTATKYIEKIELALT
jgi:ADP-heptose:LPS heptosyltransferase